MTENKRHWDTLEGMMELSTVANEILARHRPIDRDRRVPPGTYLRRRNSLREAGKERGYDVIILYGQGADPSSIIWSTGYKTLFCEVALAIGKNGEDVFITDPELFRTAQWWDKYVGLRIGACPIEEMGLTDELYTFVPWARLHDVFRLLAGKGTDKKIKVAIATPTSSVSYNFVELIRGVKNVELKLDGEILPPLMFNKDDEEISAAEQAAYLSGMACDVALGVLRPGLYETEVAGEMARAMYKMGATDFGWEQLVGSGDHNEAIICDAQNRVIEEGDWVNIGASAYVNGIAAVERRSIKVGGEITDFEREVYGHILEAYLRAKAALEQVAKTGGQLRKVDTAFREYLSSVGIKSPNTGELVNLGWLIAYSGAHDLGANECGNPHLYGVTGAAQPFALHNAVPKQLMGFDIAVRGYKESPEQPLLGDIAYCVIENTAIICDGKVTIPHVTPIELDELQKRIGNSERP